MSLKTRTSEDYLISDSNGDRAQLLIKLHSFFDIPIILSAHSVERALLGVASTRVATEKERVKEREREREREADKEKERGASRQ